MNIVDPMMMPVHVRTVNVHLIDAIEESLGSDREGCPRLIAYVVCMRKGRAL